jgi:hypothetical protein
MTRVGFLAGAAALTLTGVSAGQASPASNEDMASRLAAAEAKIAAMEAAQNENWLTEQRAAEIRGLVQDVLSDADTRASLLQAGMTSGYDNGFIIGDPTGNWLLRTNFLMQQRFNYNMQDDAGGTNDSNRYGFENTRSKFILSGHVVNPDWYYLVDINVGSGTGRTGTLNSYLGYNYGNGWKFQMGAMKAPLLREELVDAQYQLAVERSNVNYLFSTGYADGLMVHWQGDTIQFMGMLSDGANTGETVWSTEDTEFALTGRVEFLLSGAWDQYKDFTNGPDDPSGVLIGGAFHYQNGEFGTASDETQIIVLTVDGSLEFAGANLYGAFIYTDVEGNAVPLDVSPWGLVLQGGFYFSDSWELFGRFEWADLDVSGAEDVSIFTIGVNKYIAKHNAKWTTDIGFGFDTVEVAADITGWRTDPATEDGQVVLRTQLQILF